MKKSIKIILISLISFIAILGITIGVLAYYEYYGQYASILNVDGTIKLDAFDVLYPELRDKLFDSILTHRANSKVGMALSFK